MMTMSTVLEQTLITSRDPKGLQAVSVFEAAYNGAKLNDEQAQRLNESAEFSSGIRRLIEELTASNLYEDEEEESSYGYLSGYKPRPISEQVDVVAGMFSLSLGDTSEFIRTVLPGLALPDGAEGWFAIPSINALAARFFQDVEDPAERYVRAVQLILDKIKETRNGKFYNYRDGNIDTAHLRQSIRSANMMAQITAQQTGDILIVPGQFGKRHAGRSVGRARVVFRADEFGHGAFSTGSMLLTHPDRLQHYDDLWIDCAGDEFSPGGDGVFSKAPYFGFSDGEVEFAAGVVGYADGYYGSASGFLPQ